MVQGLTELTQLRIVFRVTDVIASSDAIPSANSDLRGEPQFYEPRAQRIAPPALRSCEVRESHSDSDAFFYSPLRFRNTKILSKLIAALGHNRQTL